MIPMQRPRASLLVLLVLVGPPSSRALAESGGDPDGSRDLAESSPLPRGDGLAAGFVADRGIDTHPDVIFAEDFEGDGALGSKWDEVRNEGGDVLRLVDDSADDPRVGSKSLEVTARLGKNTGGGMTT